MRESTIESYLYAQVLARGGETRKVKWIGRRGAPDRLVMLSPGVFVDGAWTASAWIELKAPGEKTKPHQEREHARMRRMGQAVAVIDSIAGVDKLLAGEGA